MSGKRFLFVLLGGAVAFVPSDLFALELHVSPTGNDAFEGTQEAPLFSLEAARDAVRESGLAGREAVTICIHAGTYRLTEALLFSPIDGGTETCPVTYRSAGDGGVVLTGAQLLSPEWEAWRNGMVRTKVEGGRAIDQLFVNGERQILARYPNLGDGFVPVGDDPSPRGQKAGTPPFGGCSPDAWDQERAAAWKNPAGAFLHGMHGGLWGSQHYRVLGKNADGSLRYEGGWQNNRASAPHRGYRMVENIFEELDAPGEWFHDVENGWLYYKPAEGVDLKMATFEAVLQLKHLVEIYGESTIGEMKIPSPGNGLSDQTVKTYKTTRPVQYICIEGIRFAGTARTFMETSEPLLRGDWTIYRGGAVHLRGTENITLENCRFEELGGNAIFVDHYNRGIVIRGNRFLDNGASDVNLVGSFEAVRDPTFNYSAPARPIETIDTTVGPKSDEYPADCLVENNLMTRCGRFEKQVAGVNISMSSRIKVRHNTISHTPRAAINVNDGTWGGHVIEWNDCFETVLETHDHGAFNSWGRDRIWHRTGPHGPDVRDESGKALISYYVEKYPESPTWDCYQTSVIRNNRMQCDHGWDIDLDDGSSNYEIYNNLCLKGGLKTREGYQRMVTNNVIMGKYTCNVPYPKPSFDVFERNIVWGRRVYNSSNPTLWGGVRNYTFVHNPAMTDAVPATGLQEETMDDAGSLYGNARFIDPEQGNFQVAADSSALKTGFTNFPMAGFGVTSPGLKAAAGSPVIRLPTEAAPNLYIRTKAKTILGAQVKTLDTEAEQTATGMHERAGAYLVEVPAESQMAEYGFKAGDVVWQIDHQLTPGVREFGNAIQKLSSGTHHIKVWRAQEMITLTF
jgi:hypothetical protein